MKNYENSELNDWIRAEGLRHEPVLARYSTADELDLLASAIGKALGRLGTAVRSLAARRRATGQLIELGHLSDAAKRAA